MEHLYNIEPDHKHPIARILLIIAGVALVVAIVWVAYKYGVATEQVEEEQEEVVVVEEVVEDEPAEEVVVDEEKTPEVAMPPKDVVAPKAEKVVVESAGPKDCGSSLSCLAEEAKKCVSSKATYSSSSNGLPFVPLVGSGTSYFEVQSSGKNCVLFERRISGSVEVMTKEDITKFAKTNGFPELSEEDLADMLEIAENALSQSRDALKKAIGLTGTCTFTNGIDLASALNDKLNGTIYFEANLAGGAAKQYEQAQSCDGALYMNLAG